MPEVTRHLDRATLRQLDVPEQYLGVAEAFRTHLLSSPANSEDEKDFSGSLLILRLAPQIRQIVKEGEAGSIH